MTELPSLGPLPPTASSPRGAGAFYVHMERMYILLYISPRAFIATFHPRGESCAFAAILGGHLQREGGVPFIHAPLDVTD
jgi:hypothetical protein